MGNLDTMKLVCPFVGICIGILISYIFRDIQGLPFIFFGIAVFSWLILNILTRDPVMGVKFQKFHLIWVFFLFIGISSLDFHLQCLPRCGEDISSGDYHFIGKIKEISSPADGERLKVKIESIKDQDNKEINCQNLNFLIKTDGITAKVGDIVEFNAIPVRKNNNFSERNSIHNFSRDIEYYAKIKSPKIKILNHHPSFLDSFHKYRTDLIILIENSVLKKPTSDFLISILLGEKSHVAPEVRSSFSAAGVAHILALSGMHIGVIISILFFLTFPLSLLKLQKTKYILIISLVWLFVFLTGAAPSTLRAALMASFFILALILERKNSAINSLFAAMIIILLTDPYSLWNPGLQLSFLSVLAILIFVPKLNPIDHHKHPLVFKGINILLVTLITTFCTWILISYYFRSVPLLFLPANLILIPLFPIFLFAGIIFVSCLSLGWDIKILNKILDSFYDLFLKIIDYISSDLNSAFYIDVPALAVVLWLLGISLVGFAIYGHKTLTRSVNYALSSIFLCLSLTLVGSYQPLYSETITFSHSFTKIETKIKSSDGEWLHNFSRKNISVLRHDQLAVVSVDRKIHPDSIDNLIKSINSDNSYLIVGPESDNNQITELIDRLRFQKVILHAGVGKNKKVDLIRRIDEDKWDNIYSLGETGSLDFEL